MNAKLYGLSLACAALAVSACKSSATSVAPDSDAAAASAATAPAASTVITPAASRLAPAGSTQNPLTIPGATVATLPNMSFPERFAAESKGRPAGIKPNADDVYTALKAAGLEIVDVKQHLASPQGARYCQGARIVGADKETRIDISVCEYATADVARIARDYSIEAMKTVIPNRTVYANKQVTLTLREAAKTPDNDALVDKAQSTFAKL
jgi:hypothetical protein